MMGFITGCIAYELLKYNPGLSANEAVSIATAVIKTHEGEPDTGTLWLMIISEAEDGARDYLTNKALKNGRQAEASSQS